MDRIILSTILLGLCCIGNTAVAQVPTCDKNVPFYKVDLTGVPNGTWTSPVHGRQGSCCESSNPDVCTSFEIILDTAAAALNFEVASGAMPPGALYYQIECGPKVPVGEPICLTGKGPHHITFCKPGNNVNTYRITSLSIPIFPKDDTIRIGCSKLFQLEGIEAGSATWTSVGPGKTGQYDDYLSCTSCIQPTLTPDENAPEYIDYRICGNPITDECGNTFSVCDTIRVSIHEPLTAAATPYPATFCAIGAGSGVTVTGSASGGKPKYNFIWHSGQGQHTGNSFFANQEEIVQLEVRDALYSSTCPAAFLSIPVTVIPSSETYAGVDQIVCASNPDVLLSSSITNATGGSWSGGSGTFSPSPNDLNVTYHPSSDEIEAGFVSLTFTTSGANGGCQNASDKVDIVFQDTIKAGISFIKCFTNPYEASIATVTPSGGDGGPYFISWDGGLNFGIQGDYENHLAQGHNYKVVVRDNSGCISSAITFNVPSILTLSSSLSQYAGENNISCYGSEDGSIDLDVSGGKEGYFYEWNNGATTEDLVGIKAGVYYVSVRDKNGCRKDMSVTLVQPDSLTLTLTSPVLSSGYNISCYGYNDGMANSSISGGEGNSYVYSWSGPNGFSSAEDSLSGLMAGIYSLSVSDQNNCITSGILKLTEPDSLSVVLSASQFSVGQAISCKGKNDGSLLTEVTGGGNNSYSYSWIGPDSYRSSSKDIAGLKAGTYTLVVTNNYGCSASSEAVLNEPELLTVKTEPFVYSGGFNISCSGASDGVVSSFVSGGDPTSHSYNWTGPKGLTSSKANISGLPGGTYIVTATDANGCAASDSVTLTEPAPLNASLKAKTYQGGFNISCHESLDGTVYPVITGGDSASYTFSWSGPASFSSNQDTLTNIAAGSYSLVVSDANSCSDSTTILLSAPEALTVELTANKFSGGFNISCNGMSDGIIHSTISGGDSTSYTYLWSGPYGFASPQKSTDSLKAGTYTLTVNDGNECTTQKSITLVEPESINVTLVSEEYYGGFNIRCNNASDGKIFMDLTGGDSSTYSYLWTGPDGFTSRAQNISGLQAGSYYGTVTDENGCSDSSLITLSEPEPLALILKPSHYSGGYGVSCKQAQDGSMELTVTGGDNGTYNYSWSGPEAFTSQTKNIANLKAGTYIIIVTDDNGCSITDTIDLTEPDSLEVILISPTFSGESNISCNGLSDGAIDIKASGGDTSSFRYNWEGPDGFTASEEDPEGLTAGKYFLTLADANGCLVADSIILKEPDSLIVQVTSESYHGGFNTSCTNTSDGKIYAWVQGGDSASHSYSWYGPEGFRSAETSVESAKAGKYTLTVTDANGCLSADSIELKAPDSLTNSFISSAINNFNISCNGFADGAISAHVSGGDSSSYSFSWAGPNGFISEEKIITNLLAGEYKLKIEDGNGCNLLDTITLTEPEPLHLELESSRSYNNYHLSCAGANDGEIETIVSGGTMPYSFLWDNGSDTEDLTAVSSGTHTLLVTDASNCSLAESITLSEPDSIWSEAVITNVLCNGFNDGSIDLMVSGGLPSYTYEWSTGESSEDLTDIGAGEYQVLIKDVNGCRDTLTAVVLEKAPLIVNISAKNESCPEYNDGAATLEVSGGAEPYSILWSNGHTDENLTGLEAGLYTVTATDANNCTISSKVQIHQPDTLLVEITSSATTSGQNVSLNGSSNGTLEATVHGGTQPYSLLWNTGDQTTDIQALSAGNYSVVVTDSNGCVTNGSIVLSQAVQLDMPSGISPNNDGKNDLFVIRGIEDFPDNHLTVVNRWGNTVFEKSNYKNTWNGTNMDGEVVPDGTYFVVLEINHREIIIKGFVDVRR